MNITKSSRVNVNPVSSQLTIAVTALFKRIWAAVKEVFYFVMPFARTNFDVVLAVYGANFSQEEKIANAFLRSKLSYKYRIQMSTKPIEQAGTEKRILFVFQFGPTPDEEMVVGTPIGHLIDRIKGQPAVKLLCLIPMQRQLRGPGWQEMDQAHQLFRFENQTPIDEQALQLFFKD